MFEAAKNELFAFPCPATADASPVEMLQLAALAGAGKALGGQQGLALRHGGEAGAAGRGEPEKGWGVGLSLLTATSRECSNLRW